MICIQQKGKRTKNALWARYGEGRWSCQLEISVLFAWKVRFLGEWHFLIRHCISTVRFSMLANGSPSCLFKSSYGLRQGNPLSPFLFMIIMEAFYRMLAATVEGGFVLDFWWGAVIVLYSTFLICCLQITHDMLWGEPKSPPFFEGSSCMLWNYL